MKHRNEMTTSHGAPVVDDKNGVTVGEGGPLVLGDHWFLEKMSHFNRERIPERSAFVKGVGAHGYFEAMEPMGGYTRARLLHTKGVRTPVFARFSMMFSEKGSPDTERDVRAMELKFYTDEGNFNLLLSSFPVTPIRDMMRYPDLLHARKASPHTGIVELERFFDFYSGMPEMTNWMVRYYSDQGTRGSYRKTSYYSVGTYLFSNGGGVRHYVRFSLLPVEGEETLGWGRARELAAQEPDVAGKDFYERLYQDQSIEFWVCVQMRETRGRMGEVALDGTKEWEGTRHPPYRIGKLVLNRPPQNHFAEVEQAAFSLGELVPGIHIPPDRLLQGLAFATADENRYRLGGNYMQLPINSPKIPVVNYQQNGAMRYYADGGKVNYKPNLLARDEPQVRWEHLDSYPPYCNGYVQRTAAPSENDYEQASRFIRDVGETGRAAIRANVERDMDGTDERVQEAVYKRLGETGLF